ncbi:MAG: transaldolase [Propionibacteriaceae bacterium]|jgi:transaldolase|nr:transaldolase [Propionibacteriaceae bacterium]
MPEPLQDLTAAGVSIWLDDLSRQLLTTGALRRLVEDRHVVGITSNPTIFANAIGGGDHYADQIRELGQRGTPTAEVLRLLTVADIRGACDVLRPVYDATDSVDGRVSIEVDPRLAHDTDQAIAEAGELWRLVDRPNLFVKIPATQAGLPAIAQCLAEGISINVTLIFSLQRYAAVIEAFLDGMERARAAGRDLSTLASVASFFVSRVDTEIDKRLDQIGTPKAVALKGKAAIANARLAYEHYERVFAGDRWAELLAAGAHPQRPLWASTGVKDPSYDDTRYVVDLVANGVVNTMPQATLAAVADHGTVGGDTIRPHYPEAHHVLHDIAAIGVDYDDVVDLLEAEGIKKFEASWALVTAQLSDRLRSTPETFQRSQSAAL